MSVPTMGLRVYASMPSNKGIFFSVLTTDTLREINIFPNILEDVWKTFMVKIKKSVKYL
jgi:hypothetical protein